MYNLFAVCTVLPCTYYIMTTFCPIPHTTRDQVWLAVGCAAGLAAGYALGRRSTPAVSSIPADSSFPTMGFVGCGTISVAIITGLCTLPPSQRPARIVVSPRNAKKSSALAAKFPDIVSVASSNQDVVDQSAIVFLAVLPQIAKEVIPTLKFHEKHTVVSVIAALAIDELINLIQPVPAKQACRAIPLPAVAVHKGATICSQHPLAERIFNLLGTAVVARDSKELEVLMCISCMMGPFYKMSGVMCNWFVANGVTELTASNLTNAFHGTVLSEAEHRVAEVKGPSAFDQLVSEQTPGGLNAANVIDMTESGTFDQYSKALSVTLKRLRGEVSF